MTTASIVRPRRTILAVPGSSDRFIEKSRTQPVDAVFLDLEDAVAPAAKVESRSRIVAALKS
ncbi:MAG: aldolase/citrate lyase family protein, partial [Propionibacteriaceae bacterium]|nr:aldolase/citrate lyase family protein [Propionibacteriaceae bacterium]